MVGKTISHYRILEKLGGAARGELRVEEVRTEAPGRPKVPTSLAGQGRSWFGHELKPSSAHGW
jgi:hypothetical protein